MADGIKIRELDPTTVLNGDDVLVVDKETFTDNSLTYHVRYDTFRSQIFTGDVVLNGSLSVSNDLNVYGDTNLKGTSVEGDLVVSNTLIVKDLFVNGSTNLKLDDLSDVDVSAAQPDDFLMYNGNGWVVGQAATGGGDTISPGLTDYIMFDTSNEPVRFIVTVGDKTTANHQYGMGSTKCYYLNGVEAPNLILGSNRTYIFDQSDQSNVGYEMVFYDSKTNFIDRSEYTFGVTKTGLVGINRELSIKFKAEQESSNPNYIGRETVDFLVYHSDKYLFENYMGNNINFNLNTLGLNRMSEMQTRLDTLENLVTTLDTRLDTIEGSI